MTGGAQAALGIAVAAALVTAGCARGDRAAGSVDRTTRAVERAVVIATTACGNASRTNGSGVVIDDGLVLTSAHVVVGADAVEVSGADGSTALGSVVVLDTSRDLAVIDVELGASRIPPVELVEVDRGARVVIARTSTPAPTPATVARRLTMTVDEVRGDSRHIRSGYELDTRISRGDSGAGVFDSAGRLAGIVFAVPSEGRDATFAVGSTEMDAAIGRAHTRHECDPAASRIVASGLAQRTRSAFHVS